MHTDLKKEQKFHIVLMALTLAFTVFLIAKLCGCFDFTGRYGITHITSSVSDGEGALMLDGDALTCWNTYDRTIAAGDDIEIYFEQAQTVDSIRLAMDEEADPDLELGEGTLVFSYRTTDTADGEDDWQLIETTRGTDGAYLYARAITADAIRIAVRDDVSDEEAGQISWQIKELEIDEE